MKKILILTVLLIGMTSKTATALHNEGFAEIPHIPAIPVPHNVPALPAIIPMANPNPKIALATIIAFEIAYGYYLCTNNGNLVGGYNNVQIGAMSLGIITIGPEN